MVLWLANWIFNSLSDASEYAVSQSSPCDSRYVQSVGLALVEKDKQRHCMSSRRGSIGAARTAVTPTSARSRPVFEDMLERLLRFVVDQEEK